MHTDTLPVVARRPEDRRLLREINEEGQLGRKLFGAIQTAAMAGLGILAAVAIAAATPMDVQAGEWESLGTWKCTAYCPEACCNSPENAHKTASGEPMVVGRTVAVGHLPFGTRLLIDGHEYVVEDRGVHGHHVDILHESHRAAKKFGEQYKQVFIWRED